MSASEQDPQSVSSAEPAGREVTCGRCRGTGITGTSYYGGISPNECGDCDGSGHLWRYPSGTFARWYSGPFSGGWEHEAARSDSEERTERSEAHKETQDD